MKMNNDMEKTKKRKTTKKTRKKTGKNEKGSKKQIILIISKDNFQGKGRKHCQNYTETKQNEKKRKGFEKKLLVAIPKGTKDHFRSKGKKNENAKGMKNRNGKNNGKKLNEDKRGMIIFKPKKMIKWVLVSLQRVAARCLWQCRR